MSEYIRPNQVKLNNLLEWNPETEQDIVEQVILLKEHRKIKQFIEHLIRLAFESPEVFGNGKEVLKLIEKMEQFGVTPTRDKFFNQVTQEVEQIKRKVDAIYEMAYKDYLLSQMGKHLGIEDKSKNTLRATFVLEKQISDMCNRLGIENLNHTYASSRLEKTEERADQVLQYIIESYDGIVGELKAEVSSPAVISIPVNTAPSFDTTNPTCGLVSESNIKNKTTTEVTKDISDKTSEEDDEFIDGFSEAYDPKKISNLNADASAALKSLL